MCVCAQTYCFFCAYHFNRSLYNTFSLHPTQTTNGNQNTTFSQDKRQVKGERATDLRCSANR